MQIITWLPGEFADREFGQNKVFVVDISLRLVCHTTCLN